MNVVVPFCHSENTDGCLVEDVADLRADVCPLNNQLSFPWFWNENFLFYFFLLDAAWLGQDSSCISKQQPRLRSMRCHLILFSAVNAVPLILISLYWNTKSSLPLFSLSHFLLEGKKHKIRFLEPVCVSVEKKDKNWGNRQLRASDWEEKWLGPLKEINDLH